MDDKYDKLVKIQGSHSQYPGQHRAGGDKAKISCLRMYLNDLGTDADLLQEFMSHIRADEEAALREGYAHEMERTDRILADSDPLNALSDFPRLGPIDPPQGQRFIRTAMPHATE